MESQQPGPGLCPYCGHDAWTNSWGAGNACCCRCGREFNVRFVDGLPVGEPVPRPEDN